MKLQDKAKQLVALRDQIEEAKGKLDELKLVREKLQIGLMDDLKKAGFKSIKTDEATISIQITKTLKIVDENELICDLKKQKLTDYIKMQIDKSLWIPFSREAVKQGIKFAGTEITETEFISIRGSKEVSVEDSGSGTDK